MISDIQLVAQVLRKVRAGDQVTQLEEARLDEIARRGYSDEPMFPQPRMDLAINPQGLTEAEVRHQALLARETQ
jgi:hypothetical protein